MQALLDLPGGNWTILALFALLLAGAGIWIWRRRKNETAPPRKDRDGRLSLWVDDHEIRYIDQGQGPVLVLVHGIGANLGTWRFVLPKLAEDFRVIALDLPGFGYSSKHPHQDYGLDAQADRLNAFLDQLGIQKAFICGVSMGAAISLWASKKRPERFARLVAMNPATSPRPSAFILKSMQGFSHRLHPIVNEGLVRQILKYVVARRELITNETVRLYLDPFLDGGHGVKTFVRATSVLLDRRLPYQLADLEIPTLIVWGENDRLVPRSVVDALYRTLPSSEIVIHPTAGHHPMEDEPDWLVVQLTKFLKTSH